MSKSTKLDLGRKTIGDEEVIALAEALKHNHTITELYMGHSTIGDEGVIALAEALKHNHTITELDLSCNTIGDEGVIALAEALKDNHTITELDLGYNTIGDEGVIALAEALEHNHTITWLDLPVNEISPKGARVLAAALKTNIFITNIDLYNNAMFDEKVKVEIDKIIARNMKYQAKYYKDTVEFLEKTFAPKSTNNSALYEMLPDLLYYLKFIGISKFKPTYNIKNLKIFQHIKENDLKLGMAEANWLYINKAKLYIQNNWFELSGICRNFEPKLINEFSPFNSLPKEIINHIVSFLGHNSLWQIQQHVLPYDHILAINEITTTGETNLNINNIQHDI